MNLPAPPTGLYPEDYDKIEAAVMETVRGRWFLLEYARRQRATETERLVQAVDRLERYVAGRVEETKEPPRDASEAEPVGEWRLPRRLAERAREFAETLRASGLDAALCAQADALAEQFSAYAEPLSAEAATPSPELPSAEAAGPEPSPDPVVETGYEEAEWTDFAAEPAKPVEAETREAQAPINVINVDPRRAALSRLDHLSLHEKLRLFG